MSQKVKEKIIGLKELRQNADKYINAVSKGKSFTVVRRSKPIFKMMPVDEWGGEDNWEPLIDFRDKNGKGIKAEDLLRILRKIRKNE